MAATNSSGRASVPAARLGWGLIAMMVGLYLLDQVTKMLIVWNFFPPRLTLEQMFAPDSKLVKLPVIDGLLNIVRVHNSGSAFGFGNGTEWSTYVFLAIPVIAIVILAIMLKRGIFDSKWLKTGWALLMVGICGNLTDRLVQGFIDNAQSNMNRGFLDNLKTGAVIDFVDIRVPFTDWHWPAFNVADSCICIAAVIFLVWSFKSDLDRKKKEAAK